MQPQKFKMKRNEVSLSSKNVVMPHQQPLRYFSAPSYSEEDSDILAVDSAAGRSKRSNLSTTKSGGSSILKRSSYIQTISDGVQFMQQVETKKLTCDQAEEVMYPYSLPSYAAHTLLTALVDRLRLTVDRIGWSYKQQGVNPSMSESIANANHGGGGGNKYTEKGYPPAWENDLRFLGSWWICMQDRRANVVTQTQAAMGVDGQRDSYAPLLDLQARGKGSSFSVTNKINGFVCDLVQRLLFGRRYYLDLIHIDNLLLTPERIHYIFFSGLLGVMEKEALTKDGSVPPETSFMHLKTISFSICKINSAGLLVLMAALSTKAAHQITCVDLSYNLLHESSFHCLAQCLPLTNIRMLSLRGNNLEAETPTTLRELFLEGFMHLEEIDLSSTNLSYKQICVLIECIPQMARTHVLLLDGLLIPFEKTTALAKSVAQSHLFHVSLHGCAHCLNPIFLAHLKEICDSNRTKCTEQEWRNRESYLSTLFHIATEKGVGAPEFSALPAGYGPFTTNDPSLQYAEFVYPGSGDN